jgi:di-N-acetylchitobiase
MLTLLTLFIIVASIKSIVSECPCPDSSLCKPLQVGPRHEKLAFMVSNSNWRSYDYSQLTTIVICTDDFDPQLLCLAHSRQVRLVWTNAQIEKVKRTYIDGINLDMEDVIADGSDAAHQYTQLVQELSNLIHVQVPGSMVRL